MGRRKEKRRYGVKIDNGEPSAKMEGGECRDAETAAWLSVGL